MSARRVVLITRSADGADAYGDFITAQGHQVLYEPMLTIEALETPLPDLSSYQAIVFTSVHAVTLFAARSAVRDIPVLTVGDVTADAARAAGFEKVTSAGGTGDDLSALLDNNAQGRALYLRAADIARPLAGVDDHILYRAQPAADLSAASVAAIQAGEITDALFFSARGGQVFADLIRQKGLESTISGINALSLSDAVLESVSVLPWGECHRATHPDRAGMMALLTALLNR